MTDMDKLCQKAAKLLGWRYRLIDGSWTFENIAPPWKPETPWQCELDDALAALETKLREKASMQSITWLPRMVNPWACYWHLPCIGEAIRDFGATMQEAQFRCAVRAAEWLKKEGEWI